VPLADILKARIQTVGVEEHALRMEIGRSSEYDRSLARAKVDPLLAAGGAAAHENGQLWSIIDVGGSRHLRGA